MIYTVFKELLYDENKKSQERKVFILMKYLYVMGEPSKILRRSLRDHIINKNFQQQPKIKKMEKERLEEQEEKILAQLENLKQEKRKIFTLIAMKKRSRKQK
jgi:hypothetical protein